MWIVRRGKSNEKVARLQGILETVKRMTWKGLKSLFKMIIIFGIGKDCTSI